jgi:hypothetical protein
MAEPDTENQPIPVYIVGTQAASAGGGETEVTVRRYRGATRIEAGSVPLTVAGLVVLLIGSDELRRTVTVQNLGPSDLYLGGKAVSAGNGFKLATDERHTMELAGELYGVIISGSADVRYLVEVDR